MNAYFFKMNQAEKNNILDQHKSIYDGFVTQYGQNSNTQPLYVQDYANDKGGITVNNKGNVDVYRNMNINESNALTGAKYLPDETFDFGGPDEEFEEYVSMGEQKDMIGDGDDDFEHGTFDDEWEDDEWGIFSSDYEDYDDEEDDVLNIPNDMPSYKTKWSYDDSIGLEVDEEIQEPLQEQLNKTLSMFKKII